MDLDQTTGPFSPLPKPEDLCLSFIYFKPFLFVVLSVLSDQLKQMNNLHLPL